MSSFKQENNIRKSSGHDPSVNTVETVKKTTVSSATTVKRNNFMPKTTSMRIFLRKENN